MRRDGPPEVRCGGIRRRWELDPKSSEDYDERVKSSSPKEERGPRFLKWVRGHDKMSSRT